jgi:hypothetical protein
MGKRKIIQIATVSNIHFDQRMIRIASSLQGFGYDVRLIFRLVIKYGKTTESNANFPFVILPMSVFPQQGILFYLFYNLKLFFKLLFAKADVFYAVDSDTLLAMTFLSIIKRKPLIYDAHEYFAEVPELNGQPFKKKIWHLITQLGVNRSALNITVSNTLAERLEKRYKNAFNVLRNLPICHSLNHIPKAVKPVVIYQGALNQGRELELLIRCMSQLKNFECWLVGEGDLSEKLRELKTELKADNVTFLGVLSPKELKKITPQCFVGFNLLDDSSISYQDSLSNKYFDYMHAGIPSLSSNLAEYMVLNNIWQCGICIQNSETVLVATLNELINKPSKYDFLKNNALIASQSLNWENESKNLEEWLEKIN